MTGPRVLETYVANPTGGRVVPSVAIHVVKGLPDYHDLKEQDKAFQTEAADIERHLYGALPGGIYDALLRVMLKRRASLLTVSMGDSTP